MQFAEPTIEILDGCVYEVGHQLVLLGRGPEAAEDTRRGARLTGPHCRCA